MRLRVFRPDGTPVREVQMDNLMCGIFIDRDQQLWVGTGMDGQIMKLDSSGRILGYEGQKGTGPGQIGEAHMMAVARTGEVYVADSTGRKLVKFTRSRP